MLCIRYKTKIILVVSILILPFLITIYNVKGYWIYPIEITQSGGGVHYLDVSLDIDRTNNLVHFSYTVDMIGSNYDDVYYGNSSMDIINGENQHVLGMADSFEHVAIGEIFIAEHNVNLTYTGQSDIAYNSISSEVWVIFQARLENETDLEIFVYYKNSTSSKCIQLTNNLDDDYYPNIAILGNGTALAIWTRRYGTDEQLVYIKLKYGEPISSEYSIGNGDSINQTRPKLTISENGDSYIIHLVYINGTSEIFYSKISSTDDLTNLNSNKKSIINNANITNLDISANGNYVGVSFIRNSGVGSAKSSDGGNNFSDINTALVSPTVIENISCYITDFGGFEIFYTRSIGSDQWAIYTANNFRTGETWSINNLLFESVNKIRMYNPVVVSYNNTVIGFIQKKTEIMGWVSNLDTFGYKLFYKKSSNIYNEFEMLNEDPYGNYLIEGFQIKYNGSDADVKLNITYKDRITNITYSNITTIKNDGSQTLYKFFSPGRYIISKDHSYDLKVIFNTTSDQIIKIPFDPSETIVTPSWQYKYQYNLTSHNYPNGRNFEYELEIGVQFDYSGKFTKYEGGSVINNLGPTNFADFGIITMTKDDYYNFTFQTLGPGVNAYLFNDSVQILSPENAIYKWNHTIAPTGKTSTTKIRCNVTGNYYVLIESQNYDVSTQYYFDYERYPRNITLNSPSNNTILNWDTTKTVTLKWSRNPSDGDLKYYVLQISNDSTFQNNVYEYKLVAALTSQYTFLYAKDEEWYYWRVKAIDNDGNEGFFNQVNRFGFDSVTPGKPTFSSYINNKVVKTESAFILEWDQPSDGNFWVAYYNVYRSTESNFTPSQDTMVSTPGTLKYPSYGEHLSRNDRYYYYIEAVDNVGHKSMSEQLELTYSYGGTVDASTQQVDFQVMVGEILEYKVTWVQSDDLDPYFNPQMTFRDKKFIQGTKFHFWVKDIDKYDVLPIRGDWYSYAANDTQKDFYYLEERDFNLQMFITNTNETYQELVFNLTITQWLTSLKLGIDINLTKYYGIWVNGLQVSDTVCYTYATMASNERDQTSITFIVDKKTGILLELIYYIKSSSDTSGYGYSLKLVETTAELSKSIWTYSPLIIPIFIGGVAGVVYIILKKLEL